MIQNILKFVTENPLLTAALGVSSASIIYFIKNLVVGVFVKIVSLMQKHLTTTLIIDNSNDYFDCIMTWLRDRSVFRHIRELRLHQVLNIFNRSVENQ